MDFTKAKNGPTLKSWVEISFTYISRQSIINNFFPTSFTVKEYDILSSRLVLNKNKRKKQNKYKIFIDIHDMFSMVTEFMNYGQQTVRAARYIGQGFMITLSHASRLPVTIQYPYEKLITSERFRGRIHFEFDKCIACEVCVRVCPIDLPVVDWKLETAIRKKRLLNYSIDFGICIFCGNCVEYCPTNCLSMTEEYELSTYDRHELNYNQIALGRLPMSIINDYTTRTILNLPEIKKT
nr:NADH-plastoquinone oxidoreductase subunit I [Hansenia forbesii]